jgi:hypothetical protein
MVSIFQVVSAYSSFETCSPSIDLSKATTQALIPISVGAVKLKIIKGLVILYGSRI